MFKQALLTSVVVIFAGSAAFAGSPSPIPKTNEAIVFRNSGGPFMVMRHQSLAQAPGQPLYFKSKHAFAGNFSDEPNALYVPFVSYLVENNQVGVSFVASKTKKLKGIDLSLQIWEGSGQADVAIFSDVDGLPGKRLDGAAVTPFTAQACCALLHADVNVKVKSGQQYWVVVTPDHGLGALWQEQDSDFVSEKTDAVNTGGGWQLDGSGGTLFLPAFQVE